MDASQQTSAQGEERPLQLSTEQVQELLPQREPFLFLNGPAEVVPGHSVSAQVVFARDLPVYRGHFPGYPLTPGVLIVEAMAQAASLMVLTLPEFTRYIGYFVGMNDVRFHKMVFPGSTLQLRGRLTGSRHGLFESSMEAFHGETRVASAVLVSTFRARRSLSDTEPPGIRA